MIQPRQPQRAGDAVPRGPRVQPFGAVVFAGLLLAYRYLAVPMAEYPVAAGAIVIGLLAGVAVAFHATWFAAEPARQAVPAAA